MYLSFSGFTMWSLPTSRQHNMANEDIDTGEDTNDQWKGINIGKERNQNIISYKPKGHLNVKDDKTLCFKAIKATF